jgi:uncharacterized protein (DUF736 family)
VNYDPNMKGVLFRNDKGENANRPDYRGTCVINNVDYNVSGWIKASKKTGDKYMSLSFQAKSEGKLTRSNQPAKTEMTEDNWHDDAIPF